MDTSKEMSEVLDQIGDTVLWNGLGQEKVLTFSFMDVLCSMALPLAHSDLIQKTILKHRTFFEHYLLLRVMPLISAGDVVLDVGANIGNHTVFFAKVCKAGRVLSFEPGKVAYQLLTKNIEINSLNNVEPINVAVGSTSSFAQLVKFSQKNLGGMSLEENPKGSYPVRSIDSYKLDRVDFVKIDVESSEGAVLTGAKETLARCKPKLWVEILSRQADHPSLKMLTDLGYRLSIDLGKTDAVFTHVESGGGSAQ